MTQTANSVNYSLTAVCSACKLICARLYRRLSALYPLVRRIIYRRLQHFAFANLNLSERKGPWTSVQGCRSIWLCWNPLDRVEMDMKHHRSHWKSRIP